MFEHLSHTTLATTIAALFAYCLALTYLAWVRGRNVVEYRARNAQLTTLLDRANTYAATALDSRDQLVLNLANAEQRYEWWKARAYQLAMAMGVSGVAIEAPATPEPQVLRFDKDGRWAVRLDADAATPSSTPPPAD